MADPHHEAQPSDAVTYTAPSDEERDQQYRSYFKRAQRMIEDEISENRRRLEAYKSTQPEDQEIRF